MMNRTINHETAVYNTAYKTFEAIRDCATEEQYSELKTKVKALNDFTLEDVCFRILSGVDEFLTDENSVKYPKIVVRRNVKTSSVSWQEVNVIIQPADIIKAFYSLHDMEVKANKAPADMTKYPFGDNLQAKLNKAIRVCFGHGVRTHAEDEVLAESFIKLFNENPKVSKQMVDENGNRVKDDYSANSVCDAFNAVVHAIAPSLKQSANSTIACNMANGIVSAVNVKTELNQHKNKTLQAIQFELVNKAYSFITNTAFKMRIK